MLKNNVFIKVMVYIVQLGFFSFCSSVAIYYLYPLLIEELVLTNRYDTDLLLAFILTFFNYNIFLLFKKFNPRFQNMALIKKALFCLLFPPILWGIFQTFGFGLHLREFLLILLGVGSIDFFIPFLDKGFNILLNLYEC